MVLFGKTQEADAETDADAEADKGNMRLEVLTSRKAESGHGFDNRQSSGQCRKHVARTA